MSSSERQKKALEAYKRLLPAVLRHYGQALRRGSKYAPQALPRLLTLWLDSADLLSKCGQDGEREGIKLHEAMETLVNKTVPAAVWLGATPQLVSRICHRNRRAAELVQHLLALLLAEFPSQLVWSVIPAASSAVSERKRHGMAVLAKAKQRLMGQGGDAADILGAGSQLVAQLKRVCNDPVGEGKETSLSMRQRWGTLFRMTGLRVVVPLHASLTVSDGSGGGAESDGPPRPFAQDAPTIDRWEDGVDIVRSLQRPKKVVIRGNDGVRYVFLCKPKDDLRKVSEYVRARGACHLSIYLPAYPPTHPPTYYHLPAQGRAHDGVHDGRQPAAAQVTQLPPPPACRAMLRGDATRPGVRPD